MRSVCIVLTAAALLGTVSCVVSASVQVESVVPPTVAALSTWNITRPVSLSGTAERAAALADCYRGLSTWLFGERPPCCRGSRVLTWSLARSPGSRVRRTGQ